MNFLAAALLILALSPDINRMGVAGEIELRYRRQEVRTVGDRNNLKILALQIADGRPCPSALLEHVIGRIARHSRRELHVHDHLIYSIMVQVHRFKSAFRREPLYKFIRGPGWTRRNADLN